MTPDILESPALRLLVRLETDGYEFAVGPDVLRVRPVERVTPAIRAELARYKPELMLLVRDYPGVVARRAVMRAKLETVPAPRVPNLVFRDDLPYVAGQCFSCGDPLGEFVFGRCWRCRLAWRLAAEVWPHAEMGRAIDDARVA